MSVQRRALQIFQSSLTYTDRRLNGLDAAVLMEVIEHVDPGRLAALEHAVFGSAAPATVIVTTPNVGVQRPILHAAGRRDPAPRSPLRMVPGGVPGLGGAAAAAYGYGVRFLPVGADDPEVGPPTQMAVFTRAGGAA